MEPAFATGGEAVMVSNQAPGKDAQHQRGKKGREWRGDQKAGCGGGLG